MKNIELQLKNINFQFQNLYNQAQNIIGMPNFGKQMQNISIQMLNLGIQLLNNSFMFPDFDFHNIKFQIENVNQQIKNIISQLDLKIQNIPNFNFGNNIMFPMPKILDKKINNEDNKIKINIQFKTIQGHNINLVVDYGKTMKEVIEMFFKRIGVPEHKRKDKIFTCNGEKININDLTKVEDYQNSVFLKYHSHIMLMNNI